MPLDATAAWRHHSSGALATEQEVSAMLSNVTKLSIRGEFDSSIDDGWIDNVVLEP